MLFKNFYEGEHVDEFLNLSNHTVFHVSPDILKVIKNYISNIFFVHEAIWSLNISKRFEDLDSENTLHLVSTFSCGVVRLDMYPTIHNDSQKNASNILNIRKINVAAQKYIVFKICAPL